MIDRAEDEYGEDEPQPSRAGWAALRERLLAQRRESMWMDANEVSWFAHHVGKLIPDYKDHPLFLPILRAHWFTSTVETLPDGPDVCATNGVAGGAAKGSPARQCVVTIDPEDMRADLPGVARDIERTLRQIPWTTPVSIAPRELTRAEARAVAKTLAALRGFGGRRS